MYIGVDIPSNIYINILRYCSNLPNLCFSLYQHRYMYFLQGQHLLKCQSNVYENRRSGVMAPANPKNKINDKDQQSNADENGDGMRCNITNDEFSVSICYLRNIYLSIVVWLFTNISLLIQHIKIDIYLASKHS